MCPNLCGSTEVFWMDSLLNVRGKVLCTILRLTRRERSRDPRREGPDRARAGGRACARGSVLVSERNHNVAKPKPTAFVVDERCALTAVRHCEGPRSLMMTRARVSSLFTPSPHYHWSQLAGENLGLKSAFMRAVLVCPVFIFGKRLGTSHRGFVYHIRGWTSWPDIGGFLDFFGNHQIRSDLCT